MVHLRIVVPRDRRDQTLEVLETNPSVCNIVHMAGAARRPDGDVVLADVAREDASVVLSDLRGLGVPSVGSISITPVETQMSEAAERAAKHAPGSPADAVVWEQVEATTDESTELSGSFLAFMVLATLIASVGIYLDTPILIIGAMVVGPEFGPIAGFCVALVARRPRLAVRSLVALLVGFPLAIGVTLAVSLIFRATGVTPDSFAESDHDLANVIASPDFFAFFVAFCAGVAGILSLSTAKSGALIGVLISVTTIPAASNIAVSAAYGDWSAFRGSLLQLGVNLAAILIAGSLTLGLQRQFYARRRQRHRRHLQENPAPSPDPGDPTSTAGETPPAERSKPVAYRSR